MSAGEPRLRSHLGARWSATEGDGCPAWESCSPPARRVAQGARQRPAAHPGLVGDPRAPERPRGVSPAVLTGARWMRKCRPASKSTRSAARASVPAAPGQWPSSSEAPLCDLWDGGVTICRGTGRLQEPVAPEASLSPGPSRPRAPVCVLLALAFLPGEAGGGGLLAWAALGLLGLRLPPPAAWATLQGTGTQLRDAQAKKEQLAARVQAVQAMLAMDTGRSVLAPALGPVPGRTALLHGHRASQGSPAGSEGGRVCTCAIQSSGRPPPRRPASAQETPR